MQAIIPGAQKISLIAAMGSNRAIGKDNRIPWHLPADLRRFRQITWGKPILMGRRTHESIGRPLPGRNNIVLTSDSAYSVPGCIVVHDLESALAAAGAEELMVIGGASLYRDFLPFAQRLYLTRIHHFFEADTFFPEFDPRNWREIEREDVGGGTEADWNYSFITLESIVAERG